MGPAIGRRSTGSRLFDLANYALFFLLSLTFVYPFWTILIHSLGPAEDVYRLGMHLVPSRFTTAAWQRVLSEARVGSAYLNSMVRVVLGTGWAVLVTFTGGYALARRDLPGRRALTTVYILTLFFNGGLIPTFLLVRSLGLINTRLVLILAMGGPLVMGVNVLYIVIARNFLMTIDQSMEDSAVIDGASYWQVLWRIIAPLSKPAIAVVALWSAVAHWNAWFDAMVFAPQPDVRVLQLMIRYMIADRLLGPVASATIVITIAPIVMLYPFVQRHFAKGVMLGSLKG